MDKITKREMAKHKLTKEEYDLLCMYDKLSRWEKNGVFLILNSLANGSMVRATTDRMHWPEVRRMLGLGK